MGLGVVVATAVLTVFLIFFHLRPATTARYRFVIYQPDVTTAEIVGTFTDWKPVSLNRIGAIGYWDITMNLPEGEHRFAYVLDGKGGFADPTIQERELDDFGGNNSIISVGSRT
ncbi:MAG: hypothetical protein JRJ29_12555 [Deltaproteobacteria bacterium]|nr:hypothetical protein [Deltaproteobacteria bacterium]